MDSVPDAITINTPLSIINLQAQQREAKKLDQRCNYATWSSVGLWVTFLRV